MNTPDDVFGVPRLAAIYDLVDDDRSDLVHYVAMVAEFEARRVLDIGCGTGTFATLLARNGSNERSGSDPSRSLLIAVDPARASLDVARTKPAADRVTWVHADAASLPAVDADVAFMTGNVAQVFVTDHAWSAVLQSAHAAIRPGGRLVFETRDPARRAWDDWTRSATERVVATAGGDVRTWTQVTHVAPPLVTFEHVYEFASDGATLTSTSTLRFRTQVELATSLRFAGFTVDEIREAPDRPGLEWVYVATRS